MIFSKPTLAITLLAAHTVAQSCTLDFYFNLAGEFNCGGFPLTTAPADATSCADISTITLPVVGKHWNAFKGVNVPVGCSGLSNGNCLEIPCNDTLTWTTVAAYADTACLTTADIEPATTSSGCYAPSNYQTVNGAKLICPT